MRILAGKRGQVRPPVLHFLGSPAASKLPMARLVAAELASRAAGEACSVREVNLTTGGEGSAGGDNPFSAATTLCGERCKNLVILANTGDGDEGSIHAAEALLRCGQKHVSEFISEDSLFQQTESAL